MRKLLSSVFFIFSASALPAQQVVPLYSGQVPNSKPCDEKDHEFMDTSRNKNGLLIVDHITKPTLTIYEPSKEKRTGTAVIICPGGGYGRLAAGHEGDDVARVFNDFGVTAFVLRYRLPKDACMTDKAFVPLMDAQEAISFVRSHAKQYSVNTDKIGIMGFSAGGHLASTTGTHFTPVNKDLGT